MRVGWLGLAAVAAVVALPAVARAEAPPISKIKARALPPAETKRRVLEQLSGILIEGPRQKTRSRCSAPSAMRGRRRSYCASCS